MKLRVGVNWTQWFVGVWWWPVRRDLAFGLIIGPVYVQWTRH